MNIQVIITIIDFLLWLIIAANVMYVLFFALVSHLPKKEHLPSAISHQPSFLVLIPAYHEDTVIINTVESFLHQDYPQDLYQLCVISDHMETITNEKLAAFPITLLQPTFEKSSKAKALQYAISQTSNVSHHPYDYVVILDADNVVATDFLSRLSQIVHPDIAIQCHRTAKNVDNDIAVLDGLSEEINNSIFRRGHNRIGLSSALIGSGMCFNYEWFKNNVNKLDSTVEDRELEALLMKQGIFIHYSEDIQVLDEKVSNGDNFQRQRLRWMTGQVQALSQMLPYAPKAIFTGKINYIDKTIQQALIPRSILLILTPLFAFISFIIAFFIPHLSFIFFLWLLLLILLIIAIFLSIPASLQTSTLFSRIWALPQLVWRMLMNILHIRTDNNEFIHTTHQQ